jgi:ABC-type sugar transport system permease subunit
MVSPSVLLIAAFGIFPLFFTVYVSLFNWRLAGGRFLGLGNFQELLGPSVLPVLGLLASVGGIVLGAAMTRSRAESRLAPRSPAARWGPALRRAAGLVALGGASAAFVLTLPRAASQGDQEVFDSLRVTIWYSALTVPVQLAAGLVIAGALTRKFRGRQLFRVVYLLPCVAPTVATAAVFQLLFSLRPDSPANQLLAVLGLRPLQWLQEAQGIIPLLFRGGAQDGTVQGAAAGMVSAYWAQWAHGPSLALVSIVRLFVRDLPRRHVHHAGWQGVHAEHARDEGHDALHAVPGESGPGAEDRQEVRRPGRVRQRRGRLRGRGHLRAAVLRQRGQVREKRAVRMERRAHPAVIPLAPSGHRSLRGQRERAAYHAAETARPHGCSSEPKQQATWTHVSLYFPVRKSAEPLIADILKEEPPFAVGWNLLKKADLKAEPLFAGYDLVRDAISSAYSRILDGADIDSTLGALQAQAQKILKDSSP